MSDVDFSAKILSCLAELCNAQILTRPQKTLLKTSLFQHTDAFVAAFRGLNYFRCYFVVFSIQTPFSVLKLSGDLEDFVDTLNRVIPANALLRTQDLNSIGELFQKQSTSQQGESACKSVVCKIEKRSLKKKKKHFISKIIQFNLNKQCWQNVCSYYCVSL
jgi:hypothetical protein